MAVTEPSRVATPHVAVLTLRCRVLITERLQSMSLLGDKFFFCSHLAVNIKVCLAPHKGGIVVGYGNHLNSNKKLIAIADLLQPIILDVIYWGCT